MRRKRRWLSVSDCKFETDLTCYISVIHYKILDSERSMRGLPWDLILRSTKNRKDDQNINKVETDSEIVAGNQNQTEFYYCPAFWFADP